MQRMATSAKRIDRPSMKKSSHTPVCSFSFRPCGFE